jgi:tetratricopeptide (TPR) repeat protein
MNKFRGKSLEELEDLEQELLDKSDEEEKWTYYSDLISLYEEMYRQSQHEQDTDYKAYAKTKLVLYLIKYGSHLKTSYEQNDKQAEECLKKVLKYEPENPIAHYRLGFLAYKERKYVVALNFFEKAVTFHKQEKNTSYGLSEQQIFNAYRYLANSALHIAMEAHKDSEELLNVDVDYVPNKELSPLYTVLKNNEEYLQESAFYYITETDITTCSKQKCEDTMDDNTSALLLYFTDREIRLKYGKREESISKGNGDKLAYFLQHTSERQSVTRFEYQELPFVESRKEGDMSKDTFRNNIARLNNLLEMCGAPKAIVKKKRLVAANTYENACYFDGSIPFVLMYRVDDDLRTSY